MKQLIINADDFGLSERINRGVIEAHQKGSLTSASILVNGPWFENAVSLAKDNPDLGLGVHLNILRGRPLSSGDEVKTLIGENGLFLESPFKLLIRILFKQVDYSQIEKEFKAQIMKVISSGIHPTHLDSEKHIHILPGILKVMIKVGRELGVTKIRCLKTSIQSPYFFSWKRVVFPLFDILALVQNKELKRNSFLMPDRIYGIFESGSMLVNRYIHILTCLPEGSSEIVCHPGYRDNDLDKKQMGKFNLNEQREAELNILLKPELKTLAKDFNIRFISYKDLN